MGNPSAYSCKTSANRTFAYIIGEIDGCVNSFAVFRIDFASMFASGAVKETLIQFPLSHRSSPAGGCGDCKVLDDDDSSNPKIVDLETNADIIYVGYYPLTLVDSPMSGQRGPVAALSPNVP